MKKWIAFLLILTSVLMLAGCRKEEIYGDFKYINYEDECYIVGLTEEGMQKETLIVPETIAGLPITALDKRTFGPHPQWESEKLKRIYVFKNLFVCKDTFLGCPNLNSAFILNVNIGEKIGGGIIGEIAGMPGRVFATYIFQERYYENDYTNYDVYPANITYYYNYDNAPNGGCYWLDNLENGEKITEIPQEPEREGYIFTGWYKEPECVNAWNFGRDTIIAGEDEYIENALYAQWIPQ